MEFNTDQGSAFATVTYELPEASDNDGEPSIECIPDFLTLGIGANTIKCKAVDAAGNEASCEYTITVKGKNV